MAHVQLPLLVICAAMALSGCGTSGKRAVGPDPKAEPKDGAVPGVTVGAGSIPTITPQPGSVTPIPEGCLSMEFLAPTDDSRCKREASGRISAVVTPIDREEPLLKQWGVAEFGKTVRGIKKDDPESRHVPGPVPWEYLEKYLRPSDEIWTFGVLDTGFVVIRDSRLFCLVVTDHAY